MEDKEDGMNSLNDWLSSAIEDTGSMDKKLLSILHSSLQNSNAVIKAKESECDDLENELAVSRETITSLNNILRDTRAEISRLESMCESSDKACKIAEDNLAAERARTNQILIQMQQMMNKPEVETETPDIPAPLGWNMDVMRDGADKIMRVSLTPKE